MTAGVQSLHIGQSPSVSGQFTPATVSSAGNSFVQSRDSFVAHSEEPQDTAERPSFFTRLVQGIVNTARNVWRFIRQYNPITWLFNRIEQITVSGLLENARNRNGATTQTELENYHRSIEYNPDSLDNKNAIFRFQRSTRHNGGLRQLVVISLGHTHDFDTPTHTAGIHELTQRFLDAGCDVLTVRSGTMSHELWNRFGVASPLHPQVVETHVGNLIEDAYRGVGIFPGSYQGLSAVCYSFGAGCFQHNLERLKNIPIRATVYIDPIQHRAHELACPIEDRPQHSGSHCLFYQENSYFVNGTLQSGLRLGDRATQIHRRDICHLSIDNHPPVLNGAFEFVMFSIFSF